MSTGVFCLLIKSCGLTNWRKYSRGKRLVGQNCQLFWYVFNSFKILAGILCGPSIVPRFKGEIILETSILSVGFIKNDNFVCIYISPSSKIVKIQLKVMGALETKF